MHVFVGARMPLLSMNSHNELTTVINATNSSTPEFWGAEKNRKCAGKCLVLMREGYPNERKGICDPGYHAMPERHVYADEDLKSCHRS
jgi:hypothetical protein